MKRPKPSPTKPSLSISNFEEEKHSYHNPFTNRTQPGFDFANPDLASQSWGNQILFPLSTPGNQITQFGIPETPQAPGSGIEFDKNGFNRLNPTLTSGISLPHVPGT